MSMKAASALGFDITSGVGSFALPYSAPLHACSISGSKSSKIVESDPVFSSSHFEQGPAAISIASSNHSHCTLSTQISSGNHGGNTHPMTSKYPDETTSIDVHSRQGPSTNSIDDTCRRCGYSGGDIAVKRCGCVLHARCIPLPSQSTGALLNCPHCSQRSDGMVLIPMQTSKLILPVSSSTFDSKNGLGSKRKVVEEEASVLAGEHRTGRWSVEEITYADELSIKFEAGQLPLVDGVRLNDFLSRMLRCPKSRLTKKMKYSKLNSKAFKRTSGYICDPVAAAEFSAVEEAFFESVLRRNERSDIQFGVQKQWRDMFSSYCFKLGYNLDGDEWLRSVEDIERQVSEAKDAARMAKRKVMLGKALEEDASNPNKGVSISGIRMRNEHGSSLNDDFTNQTGTSGMFGNGFSHEAQNLKDSHNLTNHAESIIFFGDGSNRAFSQNDQMPLGVEPSNEAEEFLSLIKDKIIMDDHTEKEIHNSDLNNSSDPLGVAGNGHKSEHTFAAVGSPFLKEILEILENCTVPFEHVDLWVPSFNGDSLAASDGTSENEQSCRLCFAGSATSPKVSSSQQFKYDSFGEYSQRFSFDVGCGLPGRAFTSGRAIWESNVQHSSFEHFERRGAAIQYGIKTVLALPVRGSNAGFTVVLLYSCEDLQEDPAVTAFLHNKLTELVPTPSWKIVVDVGKKTVPEEKTTTANKNDSIPPNEPPSQYFQTSSARNQTDLGYSQGSHNFTGNASSPSFQKNDAYQNAPSIDGVDVIQRNAEHEVLQIMCEHMPSENSSPLAPYTQGFMAIRLMILKDPAQRTDEDVMFLSTILGSYSAYQSANRSPGDIALLLARDCMFLRCL